MFYQIFHLPQVKRNLLPKWKFVNTTKNLLWNRNWTFPVVFYFARKLEFALENMRSMEIISVLPERHFLRILIGKKHPKIKLQRLRKIRILTSASLVHQINSFQEVLKLGQIFQKNQLVPGKTLLFMIGPFCSRHSVCLDSGFWQSSFEWKWCVFNLSGFN